MTQKIKVSDKIPLWVAIDDGSEDLIITARITSRDPFTVWADGTLLEFIEYSEGEYENNSLEMPDVPAIDVVYSVFENDGITLIRKAGELFLRDDGGGASDDGALIGQILDEDQLIGVVHTCED
jgi:hypothetical protein